MERRLTMTVEEAAEIIGISRTSAYLCAARSPGNSSTRDDRSGCEDVTYVLRYSP